MPVLTHDTHPSTVIGPDHRYGCWNMPEAKDCYPFVDQVVQSRGVVQLVVVGVPNRSSRDCRYDLSLSDPNCSDCQDRGQGEDYVRSVREFGA